MTIFVFFLISYLIGTFPTGHLIAHLKGVDLNHYGSGNVGATNVGRALGTGPGFLTLIGDILKGYIAVFLAEIITGNHIVTGIAAFAVVLGHCFSVPGRLKGGKGVATALGVLTFYSPECAGLAIAMFVAILAIFRIVSLASVCATISGPIWALFLEIPDPYTYSLMWVALLVVARHKDNLKRLVEGNEPKLSPGST